MPSPQPLPGTLRSSLTARVRTVGVATLALTGVLTATLVAPAQAATISVTPVRTITTGSSINPVGGIADNGTLYAVDSGDIQVWAPSSDGTPVVTKTFTGTDVSGSSVPALSPSLGLAYIDGGSTSVDVLDPAQPDGAAAPVRSISGALTEITQPQALAWTPEGSLWVLDATTGGDVELLRFAPGANGNVAPVQKISGNRTQLDVDSLGISFVAGLPGNAVAVAPAAFDPSVSVFTATQTGDVAPSRRLEVPTPRPSYLSEGVATDPQGRIYIGSGDINGNDWGRLDVFAPGAPTGAAPILTLGGAAQRLRIPLLPTVAANGTIALLDATIVTLGGSTIQSAKVKVFRPLFTKPGRPAALSVSKSASKVTFRWKPATNPSGTPLTYKVVVRRSGKTVLSRSLAATSLGVSRTTLPRGKLTVSVTAVNVGGSGPTAGKSFSS
ncbi:hypothetical protein [Nocardioides rubriscoriae]|uniref:hypothetical protein n=1 Tax=Nocardioides rubriscoriae TaxID=642762 RepID=UPI0011DF7546|nr:hypothetical protein [Nocardioides rubriscoriae]